MSKPDRKPIIKITPENKCSHCPGTICCGYLTQQISTPRSMKDFDHLMWQLSHRGIQLFKDGNGWFLLINNPCLHLLPDGRCGIYERRPKICRDHDNDFCEFDEPAEKNFEFFFDGAEALDRYCRGRFKYWDARFGKW